MNPRALDNVDLTEHFNRKIERNHYQVGETVLMELNGVQRACTVVAVTLTENDVTYTMRPLDGSQWIAPGDGKTP